MSNEDKNLNEIKKQVVECIEHAYQKGLKDGLEKSRCNVKGDKEDELSMLVGQVVRCHGVDFFHTPYDDTYAVVVEIVSAKTVKLLMYDWSIQECKLSQLCSTGNKAILHLDLLEDEWDGVTI